MIYPNSALFAIDRMKRDDEIGFNLNMEEQLKRYIQQQKEKNAKVFTIHKGVKGRITLTREC